MIEIQIISFIAFWTFLIAMSSFGMFGNDDESIDAIFLAFLVSVPIFSIYVFGFK